MYSVSYTPPALLKNGRSMTVYTALRASRNWGKTLADPEPLYQETIFVGAGEVPIFGLVAIPQNPISTIIGTYGVIGNLDNQWFLRLLGRKAFAQNCAVVLFDWRGHGKTAQLGATLSSDGLYEGEDFVRIAAAAKRMGCPAPFWLTGFSLGGQLALWGVNAAQTLESWGLTLGLNEAEIGGGAVICPSLDSQRSLTYLAQSQWGRYLDKAITLELKRQAWRIHQWHPEKIDPAAIKRVKSIWSFDRELVIKRWGFSSVEEYYHASSALSLLPHLRKPLLILYALDDPMFDPAIISDLQAACAENSAIDLGLTAKGGHVGYISSKACQKQNQDRDRWWAWNRILDWCKNNS